MLPSWGININRTVWEWYGYRKGSTRILGKPTGLTTAYWTSFIGAFSSDSESNVKFILKLYLARSSCHKGESGFFLCLLHFPSNTSSLVYNLTNCLDKWNKFWRPWWRLWRTHFFRKITGVENIIHCCSMFTVVQKLIMFCCLKEKLQNVTNFQAYNPTDTNKTMEYKLLSSNL